MEWQIWSLVLAMEKIKQFNIKNMKYLKIIIILIAISCNGQLKNRNNMEMEISDKIEYFKSSELLSK